MPGESTCRCRRRGRQPASLVKQLVSERYASGVAGVQALQSAHQLRDHAAQLVVLCVVVTVLDVVPAHDLHGVPGNGAQEE